MSNTPHLSYSLKSDLNLKLHSYLYQSSSLSYCHPLYNFQLNSLSIHILLILSIHPSLHLTSTIHLLSLNQHRSMLKPNFNTFNFIHYYATNTHPFPNHPFLFLFLYINYRFSCFYFIYLTNPLTPHTSHI